VSSSSSSSEVVSKTHSVTVCCRLVPQGSFADAEPLQVQITEKEFCCKFHVLQVSRANVPQLPPDMEMPSKA